MSATSADEAAALLEDRADVQLIVNDITLPGTMNGLKLAARAKAPRPEMNVIIVTGYAAPKTDEIPTGPIRSKTIQCPKNDRGSTAFPVAIHPLRWTERALYPRGRWTIAAISCSLRREDGTASACKTLTLLSSDFNAAPAGGPVSADHGGSAMLFDENALAGDWRKEVLHCRNKSVSINRDIAFAVAIADLLCRL